MSRLWSRVTVACFATLSIASSGACGDDDDGESSKRDAAPQPDTDAAVDAGPKASAMICTGDLPVMRALDVATGNDVEPDWSCYDDTRADADAGSGSGSSSTRSVVFHLSFSPAGSGAPDPGGLDKVPAFVEGVMIDFFFGPSTLGRPVVTRMVEPDAGSVTFDVPAATTMLSARIHEQVRDNPAANIVEIREYDLPIPVGGGSIEGFVLFQDSRRLGASFLLDGDPEDPKSATIIANARDCRERDVSGARFELIDDETGVAVQTGTERGAPRVAYSRFALPDRSCEFSSAGNAGWLMVNAPVNVKGDTKTHAYRLRLSGRMRASDAEPVILGEPEVELFAGSMSLVRAYRVTPP